MTTLLSVDGAEISILTALKWRLISGDTSFFDETIKNAAIVGHAAKSGITASADELQTFFNELRYELELDKADDLNAWLMENKFDLKDVQDFCEIGVLRNKIRAGVADSEIADHYSANKSSYDVAELYSITVESEDTANELFAQLEEGDESFQALAVEHSIDGDTFRQGGFVGEVTRETVRGEVEAAVFAASPGDLIGPLKDEDGFTIYMVRTIIQPELDAIRDTIHDELFEAKIDEITASAKVVHSLLGIEEDIPTDDDED